MEEEFKKNLEEKEKKIALLLEDLASLENYVHDLFDFSPLPISFVSPLGVILEVNPAFERISGFGFDELVGEPASKIFEKEKIEELGSQILKKEDIAEREIKLFTKEKKSLGSSGFCQGKEK